MLLGFFDPDCYYFNPEGRDECGGYYDDEGQYHDADDEYLEEEVELPAAAEDSPNYHEYEVQEHTQPLLAVLKNSAEGVKFAAVLGNLPYKAGKQEIEAQLKAHNIEFQKLEMKLNASHNLVAVNLHLKDKDTARRLLALHGTVFLGRKLRVDFPDFEFETGTQDVAPEEEEAEEEEEVKDPPQPKKAAAPRPKEPAKKPAAKPVAESTMQKRKLTDEEKEAADSGYIVEEYKPDQAAAVPKAKATDNEQKREEKKKTEKKPEKEPESKKKEEKKASKAAPKPAVESTMQKMKLTDEEKVAEEAGFIVEEFGPAPSGKGGKPEPKAKHPRSKK